MRICLHQNNRSVYHSADKCVRIPGRLLLTLPPPLSLPPPPPTPHPCRQLRRAKMASVSCLVYTADRKAVVGPRPPAMPQPPPANKLPPARPPLHLPHPSRPPYTPRVSPHHVIVWDRQTRISSASHSHLHLVCGLQCI